MNIFMLNVLAYAYPLHTWYNCEPILIVLAQQMFICEKFSKNISEKYFIS